MKATERELKIYLFLIILVVLLAPHAARFLSGNTELVGEESYYNLRLAEDIIENKMGFYDGLITSKRPTFFNPYHFTLAAVGALISVKIASIVLPLIFGILSVLIFYSILKDLRFDIMERFLITLVLILSPAFIFAFIVSNSNSLAIFLTLLGLFFFQKKERYYLFLALLCFVTVSFFSFFNILLIISLSLAASLYNHKKQKWFLTVLFSVLFVHFIFPNYFFYTFHTSTGFDLFRSFVSDFGGFIGFSIFSIALFFVGLFNLWSKKIKYSYLYVALVLSLPVYYLVGGGANLYLNFMLSFFAGFGFLRIIKIKWQYDLIKNLTILIIICGLFFSAISYTGRLVQFEPDSAVIDSLEWLEHNSKSGEIVFSHHSSGHWIEQSAKRPVLTDSLLEQTKDYTKKLEDSDTLFYSRDLKTSKTIINKYNLSYIWISPEMKGGIVWEEHDEGLLFLFRNNETFKNIYRRNGIEIWQIIDKSVLK